MRLITTSNLEGVVSTAMLADKEDIQEIFFAHPKDIIDNLVDVKAGDGIVNLPFHENAALWFNHIDKVESIRELPEGVKGSGVVAPSTARVIHDFYGDFDSLKYSEALDAADRMGSAELTYEDVLKPEGWMLLGYTLDPRSGLGEVEQYSLEIIEALRSGKTIEEIMKLQSVQGRAKRYLFKEKEYKKAMMFHTEEYANVSLTDVRDLDPVPSGNRFLVFPLFARSNVNVHVLQHPRVATKVIIAVGKSVFDKTHPVHVGDLLSDYGGGGIIGAGTCQVNAHEADGIIKEIVIKLRN